jgi:hypothetical protein
MSERTRKPLKRLPLGLPGQSVQAELTSIALDVLLPYCMSARATRDVVSIERGRGSGQPSRRFRFA